jgi:hypothetical protein
MRSFVIGAALLCAAGVSPGAAQEQQSFKSLMGRGFDIKNVSFVKGEVSENREAFIVTLQRDKTVAVCFFSANAWVTLSSTVLEDPKRCDVRTN